MEVSPLDYRKLRVWQRAHALTIEVYRLTRNFPIDERYGLTAQLRRSCQSVRSNLAEGRERTGKRAFASFVEIALGSAAEAQYQLLLATDLGYIDVPTHERLAEEVRIIRAMLGTLRARLHS